MSNFDNSYLVKRLALLGTPDLHIKQKVYPEVGASPYDLIDQLQPSRVFVPARLSNLLSQTMAKIISTKDGELAYKACLISENNTDALYEKYDIVIGKMLHMFTEESLPDFLKLRLGMIKLLDGAVEATCANSMLRPEEMFDIAPMWLFQYPHMAEIGWRVDRDLYTVMLTEGEMALIQNRSTNDT